MRSNKFIASWIIPIFALFISALLHALLFQLNWNNDQEFVSKTISVKIKKIIKQIAPESHTKELQNKKKITNSRKLSLKLIQETYALVKLQSDYNFSENQKERWRKSVTENTSDKSSFSISQFSNKDGTLHTKIGGSCFSYRESNPLWQFDEPIFEFEKCLKEY